ncbi:G0/G1 switch protein 2 [Pseudoliparis swirei]|uniref:G0/G1 switch protein 2 n=1 Tax=Pseudoliparis swirei TaxID=2059687 RepID=UPI0024BDDABA|nr:G0/G1 switch protein 2 [Pseudoliparis swirei]XP_056279571.1 G0/G1 switch protein 2 [Pseudoliparis swirei]
MENIGEIIPFAKEMLNRRPSREMLKIYMLGSTVAVLGAIGGLVETVLLPFAEQENVEDAPAELDMEKEKKQVLRSSTTSAQPEVVDVLNKLMIEAEDEHLVAAEQRSSHCLDAS